MPASDVTATAQWTKNKYTITYQLDGENYIGAGYSTAVDENIEFESAVTARPNAVKEGYTVTGWTFTPALGEGNTMPASDVIASATSTVETYTIKFNTDGGTTINDLPLAYGDAINVANPTKTGYTFDGWTTADAAFVLEANANLTGADLPATMPDVGDDGEIVNVTALWKINTHTITYDPQGGLDVPGTDSNVPNVVVYEYDDAVDTSVRTTKEGYTFDKWTYSPALGTGNTMPDSDVTATASWIIETYNLEFDLDGGTTTTDPLPATVNYNGAVTVANPVKTGYVFSGWEGPGVDANGNLPAAMPDIGSNGATATYTATLPAQIPAYPTWLYMSSEQKLTQL